MKTNELTDAIIRGSCAVRRVEGGMDGDQVMGEIHETFTENVVSGVGVIKKPFCTFITIPTKQ